MMAKSASRRATESRTIRRWLCIAAVLLACMAYSAALIWRSSFVVDGRRWFCLFDDALITLRYAENIAEGRGPVWNAGERVEGVSTPLWTLLLVPFHWLGLGKSAVCLAVQCFGALTAIYCVLATWQLAAACRLSFSSRVLAIATVGLAYNLQYFAVLGMETALFTGLFTQMLARLSDRGFAIGGWICDASLTTLALLVRPDAAPLIVAVAGVAAMLSRGETLRQRLRGRLLAIVGATIATLALLHAARWVYYGELFPNTYYLKLTGWSFAQRLSPGLSSLFWVACQFALPGLLAAWAIVDRPKRWHAVLASAVAGTIAFQVYVGGDAWSLNRFVVQIVPAVAVLAAGGVERAARGLLGIQRGFGQAGFATLAMVAIVIAQNAAFYPASFLMDVPHLTIENARNMRIQAALERCMARDAVIGAGFAGLVPYFGDWRSVDILGKCEKHVARLPTRPGRSRPGHNKQDLGYSVRQFQPDVLVNVLDPNIKGVETPYRALAQTVDGEDVVFWLREGTTKYRGGGELISTEEVKRRFVQ